MDAIMNLIYAEDTFIPNDVAIYNTINIEEQNNITIDGTMINVNGNEEVISIRIIRGDIAIYKATNATEDEPDDGASIVYYATVMHTGRATTLITLITTIEIMTIS